MYIYRDDDTDMYTNSHRLASGILAGLPFKFEFTIYAGVQFIALGLLICYPNGNSSERRKEEGGRRRIDNTFV